MARNQHETWCNQALKDHGRVKRALHQSQWRPQHRIGKIKLSHDLRPANNPRPSIRRLLIAEQDAAQSLGIDDTKGRNIL
jgi:hypothetical protein